MRVNNGRAAADTRLALGDEVRIPPVRVADRSERPEAPAREFPVVHEDDALICIDKPAGVAVHGGSGESFGVIEQMRRARPGAVPRARAPARQGDLGAAAVAKTRPALVALQNDLRSRLPERAIGKTYAALVIGDWPESLKVIDVALRKDTASDGSRHVRAVADDDERGRRSISLVRVARRFGRLQPARRDLEDRPHAPDPGSSRATPATPSPATRSTATSRSTGRSRAARWSRRCASSACSCTRAGFASGIRRPATPIELEAPLPAACRALLDALAGRTA